MTEPDAHHSSATRIVVIGGGLAGLATAWEIVEAARSQSEQLVEVALVDAAEHLGASVASAPFCGDVVDIGLPIAAGEQSAIDEIAAELGFSVAQPRPIATWIVHDGDWVPLRMSNSRELVATMTSLVRARVITPYGFVRAALDVVLPQFVGRAGADLRLSTLFKGRLGDEVVDRILEPIIGAQDGRTLDELGASDPLLRSGDDFREHRRVLPLLNKWCRRANRQMFGVGGDRSAFVSQLSAGLLERGAVLHSQTTVDSIDLVTDLTAKDRHWRLGVSTPEKHFDVAADGIVLAVDPHASARLLSGFSPRIAHALSQIRQTTAGVVWLAYPRTSVTLPADEGVVISSPAHDAQFTRFSWKVTRPPIDPDNDTVLVRAEIGERYGEGYLRRSDGELIDAVHNGLSGVMAIRSEPREAVVRRWSRAHNEQGHGRHVDAAREALREFPAIELAGSAYDGYTVAERIQSGRRAGSLVLAELGVSSQSEISSRTSERVNMSSMR